MLHQVGYASRIPSHRMTEDLELKALRQNGLKQNATPGPSGGRLSPQPPPKQAWPLAYYAYRRRARMCYQRRERVC